VRILLAADLREVLRSRRPTAAGQPVNRSLDVISVVIEDWKWRMVTPKTAVYRSLGEKKP
jgi:hypothetical protein